MHIQPARSVAILAGLTIATVLLSCSYLLLSLRQRELAHAEQTGSTLSRVLAEQTQQHLHGADQVLQGIQERLASPFGQELALDSAAVQLLLNTRAAGFKQLSALYLLDAQGQLRNAAPHVPTPPLALAQRPYMAHFAQGPDAGVYLDAPVHNVQDGGWTLYLARRLSAPDGRFQGVLVAAIHAADVQKGFAGVQVDRVRPVALHLDDGTLVASLPPRADDVGQRARDWVGNTLAQQAPQTVRVHRIAAAGGPQRLYLAQVAAFPLVLAVTDDEAQSLAAWRETAWALAGGGLLVCLSTGLVAAYLIAKLARKDALTVALVSANDRYQQTLESVMDAIVAVDEQMHILLFNPAAERMFGWQASQALGQPLDALIPQRLRGQHALHMGQFSGSSAAQRRTVVPQREIVGLRADGSEFPIESTFSKSRVDGQWQYTAVLRDTTHQRRIETELRQANGQLRALSNSLAQVREQERTRISRELHDDLGQQLTGLKLSLSWLGNRIKEGRETAAQNVDDMRHQLDAAIASVRRIAAELRPRVLDDLDFAEALTWQTREFTRHSGLEVALDLPAAALVQNDEVATALFRIVQEALTNVVRHAQASQVRISLLAQGGRVVLRIEDDGKGFDSTLRHDGVGLVGMRERCRAMGGQYAIESPPQQGTHVVVSLDRAALASKEAMA